MQTFNGTSAIHLSFVFISFNSYFSEMKKIKNWIKIRHFRVPPDLCIKTRLRAQPLIWKWFFILMQIKHLSFSFKLILLFLCNLLFRYQASLWREIKYMHICNSVSSFLLHSRVVQNKTNTTGVTQLFCLETLWSWNKKQTFKQIESNKKEFPSWPRVNQLEFCKLYHGVRYISYAASSYRE